jgi:hypothetical protein
LTNDKDVGVGRNAGWSAGDDEGAPFKGKVVEPVRYLDDVPDNLWRHKLFWLFWPSQLAALGAWYVLNNWLHMESWTAWVFIGAAVVIYVVIGLRGPQLLLFGSRLLGRQSGPQ